MEEVIGDGLIKLPFVAGLRAAFPGARITWVAAKGRTVYATALKPVVEGLIDEIVTDGVTGAATGDLLLGRQPFGGRRFDVVIDTQTNLRRSLVAKRAAAGLFISSAADFKLSDRRPDLWPEAVAPRMRVLLSLAAGREVEFPPMSFANPRARTAAQALLPEGPIYVGLAPGAGGADRRWPLERYIGLAQAQISARRTPVFLIGPNETDDVALIREAVPEALLPEVDRTDGCEDVGGPALAIALAGRLAVGVANDAGPGHMLAAGGAPLVSLQRSRRNAVKFHPAAARLEMLVAEDYGGAGMAGIPVTDAAAALERLIRND